MEYEIFKLQYPLVGHDVLIYNKDRSQEATMDIRPEAAQEFLNEWKHELKIYVWGHLDEEGVFTLDREAEAQDW